MSCETACTCTCVLSSNTKLTVDDSAKCVLDNLLPFWIKSRIPTRIKQNILPKIKHLFNEQTALMKHRLRSNGKDLINQKQYTDKLDSLCDISHASAFKLIKIEEYREFLRLQKKSRTGCIGPVDRKLFGQEKRSAERQKRLQMCTPGSDSAAASTVSQLVASETAACDDNYTSTCCEDEKDEEFGSGRAQKTITKCKRRKLRDILVSEKVSAVLDRTNTCIRMSTMILASVGNEVVWSTSPAELSKECCPTSASTSSSQGCRT